MTDQPDLFLVPPTADDLAQDGMDRAVGHANRTSPEWSQRAFEILTSYASIHFEFMTEDVRNWAEKLGLPQAPSARAWGAVAIRASRENVIRKEGYRKTQNPLAHGTPATLWHSQIYRRAA